jgi:hypothetical protein
MVGCFAAGRLSKQLGMFLGCFQSNLADLPNSQQRVWSKNSEPKRSRNHAVLKKVKRERAESQSEELQLADCKWANREIVRKFYKPESESRRCQWDLLLLRGGAG